jgi:hypothetical protein
MVFAGGGFSSMGNLPHQGVACLYGSGVVGVPVADGVHEVAFTRLEPNRYAPLTVDVDVVGGGDRISRARSRRRNSAPPR